MERAGSGLLGLGAPSIAGLQLRFPQSRFKPTRLGFPHRFVETSRQQRLACLRQRGEHRVVERVAFVGAVHADFGDAVGDGGDDAIGHDERFAHLELPIPPGFVAVGGQLPW